MSDLKPASAFTLATRLHNIGAIESQPTEGGSLTAEEAREAIEQYQCAFAVCARINGRIASFAQYFAQVYGETLEGKKLKGAA